jgi:hypothetical protein
MTPVEFLKDKFNEISSRRNSVELEIWEAYQLREKAFEKAVQMEKELFRAFFIAGAKHDMFSCNIDIDLDIEKSFNQLYKKYTI